MEDALINIKPTYEELLKRIQKLEIESLKPKQVVKTQREGEYVLKSVLHAVPIGNPCKGIKSLVIEHRDKYIPTDAEVDFIKLQLNEDPSIG